MKKQIKLKLRGTEFRATLSDIRRYCRAGQHVILDRRAREFWLDQARDTVDNYDYLVIVT